MGITSLTVMGRCFGKCEVEINTSITSLSYIELLLVAEHSVCPFSLTRLIQIHTNSDEDSKK